VRDGDIDNVPGTWHQWRHDRLVVWPESESRNAYDVVTLTKSELKLVETCWQVYNKPHWDAAVASGYFAPNDDRYGLRASTSAREYTRCTVNGNALRTRKCDLQPSLTTTHRFIGADFNNSTNCRLHRPVPRKGSKCKCVKSVHYGEIRKLLRHTITYYDADGVSQSAASEIAFVVWFEYKAARHPHTGLVQVGRQRVDKQDAVPLKNVRNTVFVMPAKTLVGYDFAADEAGRRGPSLVIDFSRSYLVPD
jgi:hypothetical protein